MDRVNQLIVHPLYIRSQQYIDQLEKDRIFCKHNLSHSLDVARIAYIETLENDINIAKDILYAAALLHDIGRWQQYTSYKAHEEASEEIAAEILNSLDFSNDERTMILEAIKNHRNKSEENGNILNALIAKADHQSRNCFDCHAQKECYWDNERRNLKIEI